MKNLTTYAKFLNEIKITQSKKWVDYDLSKLDDEGLDSIWKMYTDTYAAEGLDLSARNAKELIAKYKATQLVDVDLDQEPDAFMIYKQTKYGNKIALLGTNGKRDAKKALIIQLLKLVKVRGWFIEASKKMESLLQSSNALVVTDEKKILDIVGAHKEPKFIGGGYYTRKLAKIDKTIKKRIYGRLK